MKAATIGSTIWAGTGGARCAAPGAPQAVALSQPTEIDLCLYRGDTARFRVHVNQPDGTPVDLSTATWDADIRASEDATAPLASFTITPIDLNTIELVLASATSQTLATGAVWDLEMTVDGNVQTLIKGKVYVDKDVSRA